MATLAASMAIPAFKPEDERLIRAALRQYWGHPDWEDLLQEARIAAWRAEQRGLPCSRTTTIYRYSRWAACHWLARVRAHLDHEPLLEELCPAPGPWLAVERARAVLAELEAASRPAEWEAIRLRFIDGLSPAETGIRLGLTPSSVQARVQRALRRYRQAGGTAKVGGRRLNPQPPTGNVAKTHCPRGHPYAGANLYRTPDGRRNCRACHNQAVKAAQARRKGARKTVTRW